MLHGLRLLDEIHAADQVIQLRRTEARHDFAHVLGDKEEEVDHMLRHALEALAQHGILRRDADRAGVQMALAHHDASGRDQRRGGEAELVGTQQRADDDIAACAETAIHLQRHAATEAVQHQGLVGFRKADLPRAARMLDGGQRRRAGSTLEARDGDVIGACLGDTRRNSAHTHLGHQLDRDIGRRIDVLQVEDQLGQILDRIDVMMRRR